MRTVLVSVLVGSAAATGALSLAPGGAPGGGPECAQAASGDVERRLDCSRACLSSRGFRSVGVRGGRRLGLRFRRRARRAATVEVFRVASPWRVVRTRRVAVFRGRRRSFSWDGRRRGRALTDGFYAVRFSVRNGRARVDRRTVAAQLRGGRFLRRPAFRRGPSCDVLSSFALDRPAFGGRGRQPLKVDLRLRDPGRVGVALRRGRRTLRRLRTRRRPPGRTLSMRLSARGLPRGDVRVVVSVRRGRRVTRKALVSRRLP